MIKLQELLTFIRAGTFKLNLGCGQDIKPEFINVDFDCTQLESYSIVGKSVLLNYDIKDLICDLPSDSVKMVFSEYLVEHFSFDYLPEFFYRLHKILVPDGEVVIITEDFDELSRNMEQFYFDKLDLLHLHLFANEHETFHKSVWNEKLAHYYLEREGLFLISNIKKQVGNRKLGMEISARCLK